MSLSSCNTVFKNFPPMLNNLNPMLYKKLVLKSINSLKVHCINLDHNQECNLSKSKKCFFKVFRTDLVLKRLIGLVPVILAFFLWKLIKRSLDWILRRIYLRKKKIFRENSLHLWSLCSAPSELIYVVRNCFEANFWNIRSSF